mgnify:FL=1
MAGRLKYKAAIIIAAAIAAAALIYFCFLRSPEIVLDEPADITLWYSENSMSDGIHEMLDRFSTESEAGQKITVTAIAFESMTELANAVNAAAVNSGELPDVVLCSSDIAAGFYNKGLLADMEQYRRQWDTVKCDSGIIKSCTTGDTLVCMPLAWESEVLIVNRELYPDEEQPASFEKLCAAANEYYRENRSSFFTISDYSMFFRCAMAQLGERFRAENPFDSENENLRYIYDRLATAAFRRGFTAAEKDPAALVAEGELACAVISSSQAMDALKKGADMSNTEFISVPRMEKGNSVYACDVLGLCILKSDENTEKGAAVFIKWFSSEEISSAYVGFSGFVPIGAGADSAVSVTEPPVLWSRLMSVVCSQGCRYFDADSEYAANRWDFDDTLANIMENSLG